MKTKNLILCALFATILAISAPFSVTVGPVPVTLVLFFLAFTAFTLGSKTGMIATVVYICMGLVGMPVFSNFKGGISAILSPTGGFIFSYVFVVLILGQCVKTKKKSVIVLLCIIALLVCYLFGIGWYMLLTSTSFWTVLWVCVLPFIPFDIIKLIMAYALAKAIKKRIQI